METIMLYTVTGKQNNSRMCFVCGMQNPFGLKTYFYETDTGELIAIFKPAQNHQGYPGRLHGGIAAAILDETIGRTITIGKGTEVWGVTLEFNIKYKKPIPLEQEIRVVARLKNENRKIFEAEGEIINPDGEIAATGHGKYMIMPIEKIGEFDREINMWRVINSGTDPETISI
jgi:uncharacterized protein (TIGR00369 family)